MTKLYLKVIQTCKDCPDYDSYPYTTRCMKIGMTFKKSDGKIPVWCPLFEVR